ncbi:hypothetical protein [Paraburkholderia tropica]|uniref:hypothetical protein n=1 Tax=Paraburkholderia tropica TaxID=92647 RepID=UPI000D767B09|nr:hypothetical protein [Paraburkholderia tropica]
MAIYDKETATHEAVEFAKTAIEAGWLAPQNASNYAAKGGRESAEFVGAFIKKLAEELQNL